MHHLLSILAALSLASAIPLPQYDSLTTPDIVTDDPWDTTFTDTPYTSINVPNPPVLVSETWSGGGLDQSWNGKDRVTNTDRSGMGDRPGIQGVQQGRGTYPATPTQDGSEAWRFKRPTSQQNSQEEAPPLPEANPGSGGSAGAAGAATLLLNGIFNGGLDHRPAGSP